MVSSRVIIQKIYISNCSKMNMSKIKIIFFSPVINTMISYKEKNLLHNRESSIFFVFATQNKLKKKIFKTGREELHL